MKNPEAMSNDEILKEIGELQERLESLKANIKPTPAVKEVPLHVLNGGARAQRQARIAAELAAIKAKATAKDKAEEAKPTKGKK